MFVFSWLPAALLGAVFLIVTGVTAGVEHAERRRRRGLRVRPRRGFRPVVIEGGKSHAPAVMEADAKTLAG